MALTKAFISPETRQSSPEAYAVIESYQINPIRQHAVVHFAIYHDRAARQAKARPVGMVEFQFGPEPSNPHYKQQTDLVLKAEFNRDVDTQRAKGEVERGEMNEKSSADFIATAEAAVAKAKANRDRVLGANWEQRYPTFGDVFSAERLEKFDGTPDEKIRSSIYTWASEWGVEFSNGWQKG